MKINVIITGSTGMVGEGVLHECLKHPDVTSVLVINRKQCGVRHEKLKEIIIKDFFNLSEIENQLSGYHACFFCLGVSSIGIKKEEYRHITYDLTMNVANTLVKYNNEMTFCFISGAGTDGTENGRITWARVKGKTENDLMKLQFKAAYMFRPGFIQPIKGLKNTYKIYKIMGFLFPVFKLLMPKYVCTLEELGMAMINSSLYGNDKSVLECMDIRKLGNK